MSRRLEQFCVFCRGRARENKGSLAYKASVETGSESLHATHGTGAEAQRGFPGWFPSCWTGMPCARGNFVICFMVVKYLSSRVLLLTLCCQSSCSLRWGWVLFLLQSSLMSPRRRSRAGSRAVRTWARLGSSWGLPQSMFFKLSLGEPFWMKDSFNNFISDPFLPTKPLF